MIHKSSGFDSEDPRFDEDDAENIVHVPGTGFIPFMIIVLIFMLGAVVIAALFVSAIGGV